MAEAEILAIEEVLGAEELILGQQISAQMEAYIVQLEGSINQMRLSGMANKNIKDVMVADLARGGRMFSQIKSIPKNAVKSAINSIASEAANQVQINAGIKEFRWVTISARPCPDCEDRAGEVGTIDYWRTVGRPRSGFSVCGVNCKCRLVAEDANPPKEIIRTPSK